jgi:ATP-dependent Lon protease
MRGKGEILLTGKLGDVMKESARAAISYIKSNAAAYGINEEDFENKDIHVHVPEGATPKDGPSAGITMATAILSAFTKKPVKKSVAMTGEITLRGKVLPIGGLKEKALAAFRQGVTEVIIPEANKKDLAEIPKEIRKQINFITATDVDQVFKKAIKF